MGFQSTKIVQVNKRTQSLTIVTTCSTQACKVGLIELTTDSKAIKSSTHIGKTFCDIKFVYQMYTN